MNFSSKGSEPDLNGHPAQETATSDASVPPQAAPEAPPAVMSRASVAPVQSSDVLWIDKFLARKQVSSATRGINTAPAASVQGLPVPAMHADVPPDADTAGNPPDTAHAQAIRALTHLPPEVDVQVNALASGEQSVSDALLRALWVSLESATRIAAATWPVIESRNGYAPPDLTVAAGDAGDVLLPRFLDILPPKATALVDAVRSAEYGGKRYLHANRVALDCGLQLIAAQKPVQGEIAGWHQLLLDQRVGLIVDLTRYQERENHATYAPEQQGTCVAARGRQRLVCCTGRMRLHDLKAVRQQLSIDDGAHVLRLQRLRFPGWPDHGVIAIADLIALADTVEVLGADPQRPILMHCLAGVGRTGTLMSFLAARRRLAQLGAPGKPAGPDQVIRIVLDTIARGRLDRGPSFVQMEEQFFLLVRALLQGRPGMVERRHVDAGPGFADGGAVLQEARRTPDEQTESVADVQPSLWQRLRVWCGLR